VAARVNQQMWVSLLVKDDPIWESAIRYVATLTMCSIY
jgi:hypothetical protein